MSKSTGYILMIPNKKLADGFGEYEQGGEQPIFKQLYEKFPMKDLTAFPVFVNFLIKEMARRWAASIQR